MCNLTTVVTGTGSVDGFVDKETQAAFSCPKLTSGP